MRLVITVRLSLTAALLVMVYRETGPWTVTVLALMAVTFELAAAEARRFAAQVPGLGDDAA